MLSKWRIWDFLKTRSDVLDENYNIISFLCFDPLAFKIIKDKMKFPNGPLRVLLGKEVTQDWFDDNLRSMGLFANTESYLIHFAQDLNEKIQDRILKDRELLLDNRFLILNFSKDCSFYKELQKSNHTESIKIEAPAFWEDHNLLDFLCSQLNVYLSVAGKETIKEKVPFDINSYYQILTQIKINNPNEKSVSPEQILPLLSEQKMDQFELATLLGARNFKQFYNKMLESVTHGNEVIGALYFLQSHFMKMYDLSNLDQKSRLTKYDKQLISHSKLWSKDELMRVLDYLDSLILMSKKKDFLFEQKMKHDLLKTYHY
ncbi:MAG: hypothetical protein HON90_11445 [Halobacteriovoraceae bacterium]|jgi:DNA polymerase III delta subunit|nr:hypothetical protein [Halobacteriovoraceae bacterium]